MTCTRRGPAQLGRDLRAAPGPGRRGGRQRAVQPLGRARAGRRTSQARRAGRPRSASSAGSSTNSPQHRAVPAAARSAGWSRSRRSRRNHRIELILPRQRSPPYDRAVYLPRFNALEDLAEIGRWSERCGTAQLITVAEDGYPLGDVAAGDLGRGAGWSSAWPGPTALAEHRGRLPGPRGGHRPGRPTSHRAGTPRKAEHGKVVPTWNYAAVQVHGRAEVHDDPGLAARRGRPG